MISIALILVPTHVSQSTSSWWWYLTFEKHHSNSCSSWGYKFFESCVSGTLCIVVLHVVQTSKDCLCAYSIALRAIFRGVDGSTCFVMEHIWLAILRTVSPMHMESVSNTLTFSAVVLRILYCSSVASMSSSLGILKSVIRFTYFCEVVCSVDILILFLTM